MDQNEFLKRKAMAAEQLRQMNITNKKATPVFNTPKPEIKNEPSNLFGGLNLPFLDLFKTDGDFALILGLLLLILGEKADKRLMFALIYILL